MAPRPYWKGYLKLSLVSCAVALYPSVSRSERVSFNWLNRETGNRLRQQMVDAETGEPVEKEDRVRGYQLSKHDYLPIEDDEIEAVEIESNHTLEIETFVPRSEIDPVYLEGAYYLAPDDKVAEEAFAVIREAMAAKNVVGIGRIVLGRRERLMALEPRGKGILGTVLHYNYEVRSDDAHFDPIPEIEIPGEMLDLATHIIERKKGHFDPSKFEDRYEEALIRMIRAKEAGRPVEQRRAEPPSNVVNLMDALKKSIAAEKSAAPKPAAPNGAKAGREPVRSAAQAQSQPRKTDRRRKAAPDDSPPSGPRKAKRAS